MAKVRIHINSEVYCGIYETELPTLSESMIEETVKYFIQEEACKYVEKNNLFPDVPPDFRPQYIADFVEDIWDNTEYVFEEG